MCDGIVRAQMCRGVRLHTTGVRTIGRERGGAQAARMCMAAPDVHPVVAGNQLAVVSLAVLQLDELPRETEKKRRVGRRKISRERDVGCGGAGGAARTMGCPAAVRSSDSGSMAAPPKRAATR